MTLDDRNNKCRTRTYIGAAIDEALSEEIRNPLTDAIELLEDDDFDSVASLLDDVNETCHDCVVKAHLTKATEYLSALC
jgi:hypothetical protein